MVSEKDIVTIYHTLCAKCSLFALEIYDKLNEYDELYSIFFSPKSFGRAKEKKVSKIFKVINLLEKHFFSLPAVASLLVYKNLHTYMSLYFHHFSVLVGVVQPYSLNNNSYAVAFMYRLVLAVFHSIFINTHISTLTFFFCFCVFKMKYFINGYENGKQSCRKKPHRKTLNG